MRQNNPSAIKEVNENPSCLIHNGVFNDSTENVMIPGFSNLENAYVSSS